MKIDMDNIFEGAKFGDTFKTRDGRVAVFHLKTEDNYCYIVNGTLAIISCDKNGSYNRDTTFCGLDIISRYQEPIDEKNLDELATEYGQWSQFKSDYRYDKYSVIDGFKSGYRKAKEE